MTTIKQKGKNNKATTGENSFIMEKSHNKSKKLKNAGWFLTGLVLPVLTGLILEMIKKGLSCEIIRQLIELF
ncbi:MAG: hypothetical protein N4A41_04165 [Crocinitomicaceae bacterium]|jgi:cytochrome bd-type quinol oxidase subunit 2|nr:hypothetical protein [Crocinitomicaceae bacterium]